MACFGVSGLFTTVGERKNEGRFILNFFDQCANEKLTLHDVCVWAIQAFREQQPEAVPGAGYLLSAWPEGQGLQLLQPERLLAYP